MYNIGSQCYFLAAITFFSVCICSTLSEFQLPHTIEVHGQLLQPTAPTEQQAQEVNQRPMNAKTFDLYANAENITYVDPTDRFTIKYPLEWTPKSDGLANYTDRVTFYAPLQNLNESFPSQITVSKIVYEQNISITDYTGWYFTNLNQDPAIRIMGVSQYILDDTPANVIVYSLLTKDGTRLDNLAAWTVKDGRRVFLIEYSAEATQYRIYLPLALEAINSFSHFNIK